MGTTKKMNKFAIALIALIAGTSDAVRTQDIVINIDSCCDDMDATADDYNQNSNLQAGLKDAEGSSIAAHFCTKIGGPEMCTAQSDTIAVLQSSVDKGNIQIEFANSKEHLIKFVIQ